MPSDDISVRLAKLSPAKRAVLERMVGEGAGNDVVASRTPVETELVKIWREVFKNGRIGVTDSFYTLGGDSITSLRVAVRASAVGIRITSRQILEEETIERLARVAGTVDAWARQDDQPVGEVTLTPVQRWFFEQGLPHSHHWDQAMFVDLAARVDEGILRAALAELVAHHDALRSRFVEEDGRWRHVVSAGSPEPELAVVDLGHLDEAERRAGIDAATATAQEAIGLAAGPLLTAVLFRLGAGTPDRLLLAVHHLVVDGVSMRILVDDLATAYRDLCAGAAVALPGKTASFRLWSHALARYATEDRVLSQAAYWRSVPDAAAVSSAIGELPPAAADAVNTVGRSATVTGEVPAPTVRVLRGEAFRSSGTSLLHLLLAAFTLAWRARTGRAAVQVDLERHGREQVGGTIDVSRTVGWFTAIHPVVLSLPDAAGPGTAVEAVRRRLDGVPDSGIGYGLLRYLTEEHGDALAALPQSQISFNYLGWFERLGEDEVFGPPRQSPPQLVSPTAPRRYLLDVVITGIEDRLVIDLTHATDVCCAQDARRLLDDLVRYVTRLANRHAGAASARFSPAGPAGATTVEV
jgi:non-ribosomal peptide synthase protein (TIGR01720 family)